LAKISSSSAMVVSVADGIAVGAQAVGDFRAGCGGFADFLFGELRELVVEVDGFERLDEERAALELTPWMTPSTLRRWPAMTGPRSGRCGCDELFCSTPSSRCARRKRSSDS